MKLENLRKIQDAERGSKNLSKMDSRFYTEVKDYLYKLLEEKKRSSDQNYFLMIEDEIKTAKSKLSGIYDRRFFKVMEQAFIRSRNPEVEGDNMDLMTAEEQQVYHEILRVFSEHREHLILPLLNLDNIKQVSNASNIESGIKKDKGYINKDFVMIRIIEDIPPFVGIDGKTYTLKGEDMIVLPKKNGEVLLKRGKAIEITIQEVMDYEDAE